MGSPKNFLDYSCLLLTDLLIGYDEKMQIMQNFRADYSIRKANYAINYVNDAIFF